ncbi:CAP domain-containing protein [Streptomyces sp. NPDC047072]|uniref:CAP domain-containing protein n=1 Tax=Streptomyces sp. NPDC047072 TaxID=3154809 RepID=UPI0033CDC884
MGRHRRSAAGRAATGRATGVTETLGSYPSDYAPQDSYSNSYGYAPQNQFATVGAAASADFSSADFSASDFSAPDFPVVGETSADSFARSDAYLFASEEEYALYRGESYVPADGPRRGSHRRRKKKVATPVKSGLLGVSAAVAIGTVAVATGMVPGLDNYKIGSTKNPGGDVQAAGSPTNSPAEQGGTSGSAEGREEGSSTSRDSERASSPAPAPSTSTAAPAEKQTEKPSATPSEEPETTPSKEKTKEPAEKETTAPAPVSVEAAAEAEVLRLVNVERAKVGCSPVAANSALTELATAFSKAMADEDFFDHTDPSGATPWDRAAKAGITSLGGENIARGQADAAAVMEAWMESPGHKANILNCDFQTLGVGVQFGAGGPWWTQDFGY